MNHENLWAPWRMAYLRDLKRKADERGGWDNLEAASFLADYWNNPDDDETNCVVHRNEHGMVLLNRYPYANGHLLVALGDARPTLMEYASEQRAHLWKLIEFAVDLTHRALRPQGVNVGINEGAAAGAGVPDHLHAHIVPRWSGDTNFITVVGNVRVVPEALESMATTYRDAVGSMLKEVNNNDA